MSKEHGNNKARNTSQANSQPHNSIEGEEGTIESYTSTAGTTSPEIAADISDEDDNGNIQGSRATQTRDVLSSKDRPQRSTLQNRELTDEEFSRRMRDTQGGTLMPYVPAIPDYHVCWAVANLSTSGGCFTQYLDRGYTFVEPEDVPGFIYEEVQDRGDACEGKIRHKELVLVKLPERQYQMLMQHFHHAEPLRTERGILEDSRQKIAQHGSEVTDITPASMALGKSARPAKRFE